MIIKIDIDYITCHVDEFFSLHNIGTFTFQELSQDDEIPKNQPNEVMKSTILVSNQILTNTIKYANVIYIF
jgi:hypothetical protein